MHRGKQPEAQVSGKVRLGYAVGHIFNDLSNGVWLSHTVLFFENVIQLNPLVIGYLLFLGQMIDALCTPLVGYCSDRFNLWFFWKFGKRKSWYFLGSIITISSLPLLYSECPGCANAHDSVRIFYYCITISMYQIGWAAVGTVHLALVTEITYSSKERTLLLALRNMFTTLSNLVVHVVTLVVLQVGGQFDHQGDLLGSSDIWKFQAVILVVMITGGVTSLIFFFSVQEEVGNKDKFTMIPWDYEYYPTDHKSTVHVPPNVPHPVQPHTSATKDPYGFEINHPDTNPYREVPEGGKKPRFSVTFSEKLKAGSTADPPSTAGRGFSMYGSSFVLPAGTKYPEPGRKAASRKTIKQVLSNKLLYVIGFLYMCTRVSCNSMQCFVPLYIHDSLQMKATFIALVPATLYTSSFISSLLTGPLNERFGKKITYSFGAILTVYSSLWIALHSDNPDFKTVHIFCIGILFGTASSVMLVTSLAATTDLVGSDTENSAFVFGLMTFLDKSSCGILIMVVLALKDPGDRMYYQNALCVSCGCPVIIGAMVVIMFKLDEEDDIILD